MKPLRASWREGAVSSLLALLVALVLVLATAQPVAGAPAVPPAAGYVTDLTGTLDAAQDAALEQQLAAFEARKGSQVAVLIVPTIAPEAIEDYAMRVAEQWKPGRRQVDDGALLVIALRDRQLRIEVGYGLEGVLTDVAARRIIDEAIVPKLREQDLYGAVTAGVDRLMRTIDGEALPPPAAHFEGEGWMPYLPGVAMAAWVLGMVLRRLMGRPAAAAVSAGLAGGGAWWLTGLAAAGWAAAAMAAVVVLFGDFIGPRGWGLPWNGSGRGGGVGGGGGGGFRGGGGGGGGFGGGGASGRW